MAKFGEENRAGSRGEHKYTAEEYGLSDALIAEQFADYIDQYQQYWTRD
jgi:hypothetical protein